MTFKWGKKTITKTTHKAESKTSSLVRRELRRETQREEMDKYLKTERTLLNDDTGFFLNHLVSKLWSRSLRAVLEM